MSESPYLQEQNDDAPPVFGWAGSAMYLQRVLFITARMFLSNRLSLHASGLSFYLLLSVIPFLAFLLLVLRTFQVPAMVMPYIVEFMTAGNQELAQHVRRYVESAQTGMVGSVGVIFAFVVGFVLLERVKTTLNLIWEVQRRPSYHSRLVEYITNLMVIPLLLVLAFSSTTFLQSDTVQGMMQALGLWDELLVLLTNLSGFVLFWVICLYAYYFLPDTSVRVWAALPGALVGGTALKLAQNFYIVVMFEVSNYNLIYGALAVLPLMMVWFYVAWQIFLVGAQLCCVVQNYTLFLDRIRSGSSSRQTRIYLVIGVLVALLRRFNESGKAVQSRELARTMGLSRTVVASAVEQLILARLVTPVVEARNSYVPREVIDRLNLREVLDRLDMQSRYSEGPRFRIRLELRFLRELFRSVNALQDERLEAVTISDLVKGRIPPPPVSLGLETDELRALFQRVRSMPDADLETTDLSTLLNEGASSMESAAEALVGGAPAQDALGEEQEEGGVPAQEEPEEKPGGRSRRRRRNDKRSSKSKAGASGAKIEAEQDSTPKPTPTASR